jgi:HPr kinase/phosphorylase
VALGGAGAILQGPSGSGKSDLALRFALETPEALNAMLVADDQVRVEARQGKLFASPPERLAGKIEVRGVGIVSLPYLAEAELKLICRLAETYDVPRLPDFTLTETLCGVALPVMTLAPFEPSAPAKLRLALQRIAA